ncbi:MAG: DUF4390 domain-containing protein [Deltaproteobacteria bacterium]|nr:DUF4390 domain-containing protein [Deltaproteobacteria bacterium]
MFFSTWVTPSHAQSVRGAGIAELSARADGQAYLVSFQVDGAFTEDLEEAIQAGIPTTFTYLFRVKRHVTAWFDERIAEFQVRRTVHYDNIREVYTVLLGEKGQTITVNRLDEAQKLMTQFTDMPVAVRGSLTDEGPYYVQIKAQLDQVDVPLNLSDFFIFSALWDFETRWAKVELPPQPPAEAPPAGDAPDADSEASP